MRARVGAKSITHLRLGEECTPEGGFMFHCGTESAAGTIFGNRISRLGTTPIEFAGLSSHQVLGRMVSFVH